MLSAVAVGVGPFLAWLQTDTGLGTISASGIDSTVGWFAVASGAVALWSFFSNEHSRGTSALLLGLGLALSEFIRVKEGLYSLSVGVTQYEVGGGLYVSLVGAAVGSIAGIARTSQLMNRG